MATAEQVRNSKTFPGFKDRNEYLRHPDIPELALETLEAEAQKPLLDPLDQIPDFLKTVRHRTRAGYNDPMSVLMVVDAMLHSFPRAYLRSLQMSLWLNRNRHDFIWEPVTIGRIMAEIVDLAIDTFGDRAQYPVDRGVDWRGHYVVIDPQGGHEGRLWLMRLRNRLTVKVEALMEAEDEGESLPRFDSVWTDVDTSND